MHYELKLKGCHYKCACAVGFIQPSYSDLHMSSAAPSSVGAARQRRLLAVLLHPLETVTSWAGSLSASGEHQPLSSTCSAPVTPCICGRGSAACVDALADRHRNSSTNRPSLGLTGEQ
ncbi:unnamed protein product [Pleuronectes platessa]|uniref:Uncharacterized protein n=1 Tax=Pleuronectes platessa TaxID=8262 RepID=A0A9N7YW94_PLEPL|nr:unnamed protein product [Pleuronectes platessa]